MRHEYVECLKFITVSFHLTNFFVSAPSQIQAVVFPVEELAWRMGRCSTYRSPWAVVIILQASQRVGIRPLLAIFKFDFGAFPLLPNSKPLYSIKRNRALLMTISLTNWMTLALIRPSTNLKNIWTRRLSPPKVSNPWHGGMRLENQTPLLVWQSTSCLLLVSPLSYFDKFLD